MYHLACFWGPKMTYKVFFYAEWVRSTAFWPILAPFIPCIPHKSMQKKYANFFDLYFANIKNMLLHSLHTYTLLIKDDYIPCIPCMPPHHTTTTPPQQVFSSFLKGMQNNILYIYDKLKSLAYLILHTIWLKSYPQFDLSIPCNTLCNLLS